MTKADRLVSEAERAFNNQERQSAMNDWENLAEFIMPSQSGIFNGSSSPGTSKTRRLFSSVPILANQDLAASMQATLTNLATTWSRLAYIDQDLKEDSDSARWLEAANRMILDSLEGSNFYPEIGKAYSFLTGLGTMILLHEEVDPASPEFQGWVFKALHLSTVAWTENRYGIADKLFHKEKMSLRQIRQKFGRIPVKLKKQYKEDPDFMTPVLMVVSPTGTVHDQYTAYYIEVSTNSMLMETNLQELNEYCVRWSTMPGEVIGRGPGHNALPDIKTLNQMRMEGLQSLALANRPAILVEDQNNISAIDLRPGHQTVVRDVQGIKPFINGVQPQNILVTQQDMERAVQRAFLIDKLMLPPREEVGEMTAYEVSRRIEQMQRVIGPTLSRLNHELLQPLIFRCFRVMLRKGVFGDIPQAVRESGGLNINIQFENPLSRSHKFEKVSSLQQAIQLLGPLAQMDPDILLNFDMEAIGPGVMRDLGVPEHYIRREPDVQQALQARSQQQQQQQQLAMAKEASEIEKNVKE